MACLCSQNALRGQLEFRTEKRGIVHCPIGKVRCVVLGARSACQPVLLQASWEPTKLRENLRSLMVALGNAKPEEMKGAYFRVCLAGSVRAQSSRLTPRLWLLAARDTFVIGWPRRAAGHDHFEPGLTAVHAC